MNNQLKTRQICFFFIAFMPITKLFTLPSSVAGVAQEDMWISCCFNIILDVITVAFLTYMCLKSDTDFYGLIKNNFGEVTAKIVYFLYALFFLIKAILPIIEQKSYVEVTLYETIPSFFMFFPFFGVAIYLATSKLRTIGRISDIMWIFTVIALLVLFALSFTSADYSSVLPIGAKGFNNHLKGFIVGLPWYGDCVYLLFFVGKFKCNIKNSIAVFLTYLVSALAIVLFMIVFYSIFQSITFRQVFGLTDISKYSIVISHIGRFDYLAILFILFSGTFSLAMPIYFSARLINKVFPFKRKIIPATLCSIAVFSVIFFLSQYYYSIYRIIISAGLIVFPLMANVIPILSIFLLRRNKKYENA